MKHTLVFSVRKCVKYRVRRNVSCLVFWDRVELSDAADASVVKTH